MKLLLIYTVFLFCLSTFVACKSEHPSIIPYDEALKNCIPDTVKWDTSYFTRLPARCILGAQLPKFSATTMDSVVIDTSYYKGKITLLNFWFIGCKPCEKEMPGFNEIVKKYKSKPVNFLAISNNSPGDIAEFLLKQPFDFQQVPYGQSIYSDNFHQNWGYPMTLLIDSQMKIINVFSRGMEGKEEEIVTAIDNGLATIN